MLATSAAVPGALPTGPDWAYEVKWDGVRVLADTTSGALRLLSRTGQEVTAGYPELAGLGDLQGAVVDGEVVRLVDGRPSFAALAERMHVRDPRRAAVLAASAPVTFLAFDLPMLYGVDLTRRQYVARRETLARLELPAGVVLSPVYDDAASLWQVTAEHGLEGVVAKRRTSTYQPGRRSSDWIKSAHLRTRAALVAGWRREAGGERLGAVLLAAPDAAGRLRYLGRAGSGLAGAAGERLVRSLLAGARPTSPFAPAEVPTGDAEGSLWCEPTVVVDVRYLGRTPRGRLRQPVVRGPRLDAEVDPWEVT